MRFYPDIPSRRTSAIVRDVVVVVLFIFFAWLGFQVHDRVDDLAALGRGVTDAGNAVDNGFRSAADAIDGVPIVGGDLADGLRGAGDAGGGTVADAGRTGQQAVHDLATLLGWLTFLLPTLVMLAFYLPIRAIQIRRLSAAAKLLAGVQALEHRRLLAMRAAFHLPYTVLASHTRDPFGDLEAGRYDALVTAAYAEAGLRPPAGSGVEARE